MFRFLKDKFRRWQLTWRGIAPLQKYTTYSAGDRSGVWTVLPDLLDATSMVYSFGVGNNLAWDLAMVDRFGLTIHAFDPTPASVAWVGEQRLPERLEFHSTGLADRDGTLRFAQPRSSRFNFRPRLSLSTAETADIEAPVARLATHAQRLGHTVIDVLKMDIEGAEYDAIDDVLSSGIPVRQILVEFHHHFPGVGIERTVRTVRTLLEAGYRIFHLSERGLEIGFVHESNEKQSLAG